MLNLAVQQDPQVKDQGSSVARVMGHSCGRHFGLLAKLSLPSETGFSYGRDDPENR